MKGPTPMALIPLPHTLDASFLLANEGDCPSLSRQNTQGMVPNNTATLKDAPPLLDELCARGNHHSTHVEDGIIPSPHVYTLACTVRYGAGCPSYTCKYHLTSVTCIGKSQPSINLCWSMLSSDPVKYLKA